MKTREKKAERPFPTTRQIQRSLLAESRRGLEKIARAIKSKEAK